MERKRRGTAQVRTCVSAPLSAQGFGKPGSSTSIQVKVQVSAEQSSCGEPTALIVVDAPEVDEVLDSLPSEEHRACPRLSLF